MADAREIIEAEVNKGMLLASSGEIAFEVIDALSAAGFAIVPREATDSMMASGIAAAREQLPPLERKPPGAVQMRAAWRAMVAAAEGRSLDGASRE